MPKAVMCREWGGPETLKVEEVPYRPLQPHEVRIRVRAAGVNFADTLMVAGNYQVKPPFPFTPGLEAAGEIIEIGSAVGHLRAGQRVLAVLRNGGGYAEEIVARRRRGGADPRRDGFRHRRRLSGRLRHLAFRADPSRPSASRARRCWCSAPPAGSG